MLINRRAARSPSLRHWRSSLSLIVFVHCSATVRPACATWRAARCGGCPAPDKDATAGWRQCTPGCCCCCCSPWFSLNRSLCVCRVRQIYLRGVTNLQPFSFLLSDGYIGDLQRFYSETCSSIFGMFLKNCHFCTKVCCLTEQLHTHAASFLWESYKVRSICICSMSDEPFSALMRRKAAFHVRFLPKSYLLLTWLRRTETRRVCAGVSQQQLRLYLQSAHHVTSDTLQPTQLDYRHSRQRVCRSSF